MVERPPGGVVSWPSWRTEGALDSRCGGNDGGMGLNDNEKALETTLTPCVEPAAGYFVGLDLRNSRTCSIKGPAS